MSVKPFVYQEPFPLAHDDTKYRKIDGFMALLDAHTEYLRKNPLTIPTDKKLTTVIKLQM